MVRLIVCRCGAIRKKDRMWGYSAILLSRFVKEILKKEETVGTINLSITTCSTCEKESTVKVCITCFKVEIKGTWKQPTMQEQLFVQQGNAQETICPRCQENTEP